MRAFAAVFLVLAVADASSVSSSPIQKIITLLNECKAKTQGDLDNESKAMEKYTQFCDDEASDKQYAIDTAARQLEDLAATIEDATATIASRTEEIGELGNEIAGLNGDVAKANMDRVADHQTFLEGETSLLQTIEQLGAAIVMVEKAMDAIKAGAAVSDAPIGEEEEATAFCR